MSDVNPTSLRQRGKVKFFDTRKGFGFIKPDDGSKDVFVSLNSLPEGVKSLDPDQLCSYFVETGKKGIFAKDMQLL